MGLIFQKNKQQDLTLANAKLPSEQVLDSKEDLFSKASLSKHANLTDLKFPGTSNDAKYAQAESVEKSLNDFSGTAMKVGLKGLVALSKAQQQMEDRTSQRAMRMQNNVSKPTDQADPLANLLAIFSMIKSSAIVKKITKIFSKRIKQELQEQLELEAPTTESQPEDGHLEEKPQR